MKLKPSQIPLVQFALYVTAQRARAHFFERLVSTSQTYHEQVIAAENLETLEEQRDYYERHMSPKLVPDDESDALAKATFLATEARMRARFDAHGAIQATGAQAEKQLLSTATEMAEEWHAHDEYAERALDKLIVLTAPRAIWKVQLGLERALTPLERMMVCDQGFYRIRSRAKYKTVRKLVNAQAAIIEDDACAACGKELARAPHSCAECGCAFFCSARCKRDGMQQELGHYKLLCGIFRRL